jgi:thimet oligopeptidase
MVQKHTSILLLSFICNFATAQVTPQAIADYKTRIMAPVDSVEQLAKVYPKTVEDIQNRTELAIALTKQEIDAIVAIQDRTFENTVQTLDIMTQKLNDLRSTFEMIQLVHPEQNMREALQAAQTSLQNASIDFFMDQALYQAVQNYADQNHDNENLDEQDQRLLKNFIDGFKAQGLHLPAETQEKIKQTSKELLELRQNFEANMHKANPKITVDKADLEGLAESFINSLKKDGDLYILGTDMPTYIQIMENCSIEKTRKAIYFLRNNKAYPENDILLTQIAQKQDELAQLLDFANYATLDVQNTAAETIENVQNFEYNILRPALAKAKKELDELKANLPEDVICNTDGTLNPWDYGYAATIYQKKHFNIDENKIAEYFPTSKVIDGVFAIYQKFLGLTFQKVTPLWSWHEDVQLIEIHRTSTQELLGYIFLDLYPRDNKYGHACHAGHISSCRINGHNTPSVATLICNFPKPCGEIPGLLKHDDVVTFFHEFGHGMHEILGKTKHVGQSGTSVARDFVEVPSQMFEQWMHEPEMLALVSSHYQTGESLPQEIIEQKIKLRNFSSGFGIARQCMLGLFALQLMNKNDLSYNPSALWKSIYEQNWKDLIAYQENNHWYTTFGHLVNPGYLSKYFCYLWTAVIALDLFSEMKAHGYNEKYQNKAITLLSAGDSIDAITLTQDFLEREVSQEPFFKILGLK